MAKLNAKDRAEALALFEKGYKKCNTCKQILPIVEFYPTTENNTLTGYQGKCIACKKRYHRIYFRSTAKENNKVWRQFVLPTGRTIRYNSNEITKVKIDSCLSKYLNPEDFIKFVNDFYHKTDACIGNKQYHRYIKNKKNEKSKDN